MNHHRSHSPVRYRLVGGRRACVPRRVLHGLRHHDERPFRARLHRLRHDRRVRRSVVGSRADPERVPRQGVRPVRRRRRKPRGRSRDEGGCGRDERGQPLHADRRELPDRRQRNVGVTLAMATTNV